MVDHREIVAKGYAALLAGELRPETPPVEGHPRWGLAILLRPAPPMLDTLTHLAAQLAAVAGEGHWAHGPDLLHISLRSLAPYQERVSVGDRRITEYAAALDEAASGFAPMTVTIRTLSPHPGGVAVHVHPHDEALDQLRHRLEQALRVRGLGEHEYWNRDIWYLNVVHFAGPVQAQALLDWATPRRDLEFGTTTLDAADLVRYRYTGVGMRAVTLHRTTFTKLGEAARECATRPARGT